MVKTKDEIINLIKQYVSIISKKIKVEKVVLFGSYAKGEPLNCSDVDLVIISKDFQNMSFLKRLEFLQLHWKFNIGADIIGYTPEEYNSLSKKISLVSEINNTGIEVGF
ncbi:MAG: uncharacterized protein PWQ82_1601 [Thermosediminibacterales bacterium]|nr:uncharacterized protein [Thermosediminibacterales bacterium]